MQVTALNAIFKLEKSVGNIDFCKPHVSNKEAKAESGKHKKKHMAPPAD